MKIKVGVIFGGESVEHEVSVISAKQAISAFDVEKYEVTPIYISKQRDFYVGKALENLENYTDINALLSMCTQVTLVKKENKVCIEPVKRSFFFRNMGEIDVAMPVIHGTNGEDGVLQGYLEMLKIPYVGCDVIAAAVGQDKVVMKHILETANIPVSSWFWLYAHEIDDKKEDVLAKAKEFTYPVIVKPACLGSSVGISVAYDDEQLITAIQSAGNYDFKVIVEKMVKNLREINASVLGSPFNSDVSVLEEVVKDGDILSFDDKYGKKGKSSKGASKGMASTKRLVPAPIDKEVETTIQTLAKETFRVLGTSGVCRIDFMLDDETKEVLVNEINTIPGSLAYYLWTPKGKSFTALVDDLVKIALDRHRRREKMIFSYDTNILKNYQSSGTKGCKNSTKG